MWDTLQPCLCLAAHRSLSMELGLLLCSQSSGEGTELVKDKKYFWGEER